MFKNHDCRCLKITRDHPTDRPTDRPRDRRTQGPREERTDGRTDRATDRLTDQRTDRRTDQHADQWTDWRTKLRTNRETWPLIDMRSRIYKSKQKTVSAVLFHFTQNIGFFKNSICLWATDWRTDQPTNRQTDIFSYRCENVSKKSFT